MDFQTCQKELLALLTERAFSRNDILSVMTVLSSREKVEAMIGFLRSEKEISPDDLFRKAGELAFGENA
jgi:hypothetical protein